MRIAIASALFFLLAPALLFAQSQPKSKAQSKSQSPSKLAPKAHVDLLGTTCAQVLQMTSSEWIAKVTSMDDSWEDGQLRGIAGYGKCYDERTDRLAASLVRTRKGPSVRARGSFRDLEAALDDFTAKALADSQPPGDAVKKAYAALYEKAFRYEFYEGYEPKPRVASPAAAAPAPAPMSAAKSATLDANAPAADAKTKAAPVAEMTRAKNRFGALLDAMPPDKLHEIHSAFGKIVDVQPIASDHELEIYRYAIFVLEPPAPAPGAAAPPPPAKPFAPPPF
ncbi:MAG TPA: hypothetical protein VHX49_16370 [Candidatus Acidoferrales bacterium]|jgi:hypothetical protein|nr:hypothetical protein [Candidatus Acidoferrales bacterium]